MSDQRDGFLDVVRALATIRVVLWHAFGAAALTFVAAMPAMFFVTGSLYGKSADKKGAGATLFDRLRRIGPSLWLFAAVAWLLMFVGARLSNTDLELRNAPLWFLPVGDPTGSAWEAGWLATPLWYLRTLLWVFLLAPLIIAAVRRRPVVTVTGAMALVIGLELVDRTGTWRPAFAPNLVWQLGDVVLYGLFFGIGVLARDGVFAAISRRQWVAVAAVAAVAASGWWLLQPVPEGIVNNSHPMHLFVGVAWLALAMASANQLRRVSDHQLSSPVVRFLSRRSLTVYLWHTTVIVAALWFVNRATSLPPGLWTATYLVLVVTGTLVATNVFGWVEDLAARRAPRLWPLDRTGHRGARSWLPLAVPVVAIALVAVLVPTRSTTSAETAFRPRVPSQAPPKPEIHDATETPVALTPFESADPVFDRDVLEGLVADWAGQYGIQGASVAVVAPHDEFATTIGTHVDGSPRRLQDQLDVMSITKLFTANLVYRAVDAGLLDLDAPLPPLDAEPDFPYAGQLTVRQLLGHRTGIVNYRDSARYADDPASVTSVSDAIASSVAEPLVVEPGVSSVYSSTNYLVLGLLLEQVSGRDYDELLRSELLGPLGLVSANHLPPDVGEPRYATAGLIADIGDLGRAGAALLRDHLGVSDATFDEMLQIDLDTGLGPGINGFCPCTRELDGTVDWFGLGYTGGNTLLMYAPAADLVVAIDTTGSLYDEAARFMPVMELAQRLTSSTILSDTGSAPA
jgi:CubicO group peptidase (beta-lactamase class C family)/peptidoglycan/LPS O-acetylase OafA/YrhL